MVRVEAPIFDAQLLETLMINRVMFPSLAASKASRIMHAAAGRDVVDFGARRAHGPEAAMAVARSSYLAGFSATSLVEAGRRLGIPVTGTMAHSYILSHDDEAAAFEAFMNEFPETVLLVDTYDTLAGVDEGHRDRQSPRRRLQGPGHPPRLRRHGGAVQAGPPTARRCGAE